MITTKYTKYKPSSLDGVTLMSRENRRKLKEIYLTKKNRGSKPLFTGNQPVLVDYTPSAIKQSEATDSIIDPMDYGDEYYERLDYNQQSQEIKQTIQIDDINNINNNTNRTQCSKCLRFFNDDHIGDTRAIRQPNSTIVTIKYTCTKCVNSLMEPKESDREQQGSGIPVYIPRKFEDLSQEEIEEYWNL